MKQKTHDDILVAFGEAVRSITGEHVRTESLRKELEENENLRAVGGYLIRFGEEQRDTYGTYWDSETYLGAHRGDGMDCLVHHGYPLKDEEGFRALADTLLSPIRTTVDEIGLWAETALDMNDAYQAKINELVEAGKLSWSSGSTSHMIRVDEETGYVRRWPVIEGSLTPSPANYKGGTRIGPLRSFMEPTEDEPTPALRATYFGEDIELELASASFSRLADRFYWKFSEVLWEWYAAQPSTTEEKVTIIAEMFDEYKTLTLNLLGVLLDNVDPTNSEEEMKTMSDSVRSMSVRVGKKLSKATEGYLEEAVRGAEEAIAGAEKVKAQITTLRAAAADGEITEDELKETKTVDLDELVARSVEQAMEVRLAGVDIKEIARAVAEKNAAPVPTKSTATETDDEPEVPETRSEEGLTLLELHARIGSTG